jgi:ribosome-binding factor A
MRPRKPYHKRKPSKQQIELLCGEARPEDGVDPRYDRPEDRSRPKGRKVLQLCAQVQRALEYALASECGDARLTNLQVLTVKPAPNSARLLVTLRTIGNPIEDIVAALQGAAGKLRCEVAAAIHRKKTPELAFCVLTSEWTPTSKAEESR